MTGELSPRLNMILSLAPEAGSYCDIGTDHGFIAIALAQRGSRVLAVDINSAPLKAAEANVRRLGVKNVELRRSDGFSAVGEGEAECAVLAGMGGDLIKRIISSGIKGTKYLVLQPQSLIYELRDFLAENGFVTLDEALCREEDRFYVSMLIRPGNGPISLSETEKRLGPVLLKKRPSLFVDYVNDEIRKLRLALSKIEHNGAVTANKAEYERLIALYGGILNDQAK
ncbi:MAG: SAM-dependent methyltransferase [Oscillospiraceae bacterium]|nr:SAM-dependent methyltransferase [Oscillospiraceae bacterium]